MLDLWLVLAYAFLVFSLICLMGMTYLCVGRPKVKHRACMRNIVKLEIELEMGLVWGREWLSEQRVITDPSTRIWSVCYSCSDIAVGYNRKKLCDVCEEKADVPRSEVMSKVYSISL